MRILSIDHGAVRVGLAMSDELKMFASPYKVLKTSATTVDEIARIVRENDVERVVLGMPYTLDGGESPSTRRVKAFAGRLREALPCPVEEWDEAFTSRSASERMIGSGVRKKRRSEKGSADLWAAAIILQEYLDSTRGRSGPA